MSVPAKKAPLCDGSSQRQLSAEAQRFAKELTLSRCKKPEIRTVSISPRIDLCRLHFNSFDCGVVSVQVSEWRDHGGRKVPERHRGMDKNKWESEERGCDKLPGSSARIADSFAFVCADHYDCTRIVVFSLREWWMVEVDACCVCICDIEEHPYHSTCKQLQATWLWKNIWLLWFEDRHVSWGQQSRQPGLQLNQRNVTEVLCHVGVFVTVSRNVLAFYGWYFRML